MCKQVNLALCTKALLPVLYKGLVSVELDKPGDEMPLTQLTRCLSQQPDGVSQLKLFSSRLRRDAYDLIDLRCAHALRPCRHARYSRMGMALLCQY